MAYNSLSFSVGEILTAAKMNNLQGNFAGLAAGDTSPDSAPKIQTAALEQGAGSEAVTAATIRDGAVGQAAIATNGVAQAEIQAGSVGQGELKNSVAQWSTSSSLAITYDEPFAFLPRMYHTSAPFNAIWRLENTTDDDIITSHTTASWGRRIILVNAVSGTANMQSYYIQASPPYDLGDGQIPLFIYLLIDKNTGDVTGIHLSEDPPWTGPNPAAHADFYGKDGTPYRYIKNIPASMRNFNYRAAIASNNFSAISEYLSAVNEAESIAVEVTQQDKNLMMDKIPSSIINYDSANEALVLLDPVSDLTNQIAEMYKAEKESVIVNELFHEKAFNIDNTPLNRAGPAGLSIVNFAWR